MQPRNAAKKMVAVNVLTIGATNFFCYCLLGQLVLVKANGRVEVAPKSELKFLKPQTLMMWEVQKRNNKSAANHEPYEVSRPEYYTSRLLAYLAASMHLVT